MVSKETVFRYSLDANKLFTTGILFAASPSCPPLPSSSVPLEMEEKVNEEERVKDSDESSLCSEEFFYIIYIRLRVHS